MIAVDDAQVLEVGYSNTYGNFLKFLTSDNYVVMYAHLSKIIVEKDDLIKKHETIAFSGNTGLSTAPHLHYSIYKDDGYIDPLNFVSLPHSILLKK